MKQIHHDVIRVLWEHEYIGSTTLSVAEITHLANYSLSQIQACVRELLTPRVHEIEHTACIFMPSANTYALTRRGREAYLRAVNNPLTQISPKFKREVLTGMTASGKQTLVNNAVLPKEKRDAVLNPEAKAHRQNKKIVGIKVLPEAKRCPTCGKVVFLTKMRADNKICKKCHAANSRARRRRIKSEGDNEEI